MNIYTTFPESELNCGNYNLELEDNTVNKRVGINLRKDVNHVRRTYLEKLNQYIVIVDIIASRKSHSTINRKHSQQIHYTRPATYNIELDLIINN